MRAGGKKPVTVPGVWLAGTHKGLARTHSTATRIRLLLRNDLASRCCRRRSTCVNTKGSFHGSTSATNQHPRPNQRLLLYCGKHCGPCLQLLSSSQTFLFLGGAFLRLLPVDFFDRSTWLSRK